MKYLVLILSMAILSYTCSATSRMALGGFYRQETQHYSEQEQTVEGNNSGKSNFNYPASGSSNHHTMPREYFNDKGGASQGNNGNNSHDGSG